MFLFSYSSIKCYTLNKKFNNGGIKMSFDGIVTRAVVEELKDTLVGGRINKIYQHEKDEILLNIHSKKTNYKLIISASSNNSRIYLTEHSKENPASPPLFCMVLRKHLSSGTILNIEQAALDRVIFMDISSIDELGQPMEKRIVIEIMGRYSNIILTDKDSYVIIDSIKKVNEAMSRVRQILPGLVYEKPPIQNKSNPLESSKEEFIKYLNSSKQNLKTYKFFYLNYIGLSPLISREICFYSNIDIDRSIGSLYENEKDLLYNSFSRFMKKVKTNDFNPILIMDQNEEAMAFHALELNQFGLDNKIHLNSISEVLDKYYYRKDVTDRLNQKSSAIKKSIGVKLDRTKNKLAKQKEELLESKDREKYKIYADLISANLHIIPRGQTNIELENFYDEDMSLLKIPLNNKYSPIENAQRYYKRYSKLKNAENLLVRRIPRTKNEIEYLENVLVSIENSTEIEELDEIKEELIQEGYIRGSKKDRNKKKQRISKPHHFISKDGFNIYVGKNNRQNDYLTLKSSHRSDTWLHVQKMPGSHVIVDNKGKDLPDSTLEEAAVLAAFYSKARNSNNVSVDYTERKNVRKARGAKAGMVIYNNFKTVNINPDIKLVRKIKKVEN